MPAIYEGAVQDLIDELGALPGIGPKSAQRIAFHILGADAADVNRLAQALTAVKAKVRFCETCGNVSEEEQCNICRDPRRDQGLICVVEEPKDVVAVERTREYRGLYHVLGGAIDPLNGIGPDELRVCRNPPVVVTVLHSTFAHHEELVLRKVEKVFVVRPKI